EKNPFNDLQKVMIAGGGKTVYYLSKMLADFGVRVKVIEKDRDRCQYLSEHLDNVMVLWGDATDVTLLEEENIDEMDAFVSVTGFDEENLLLALLANQRNVEDVVAKVNRKGYVGLVEKMGISMALNPLDMSATNILRYIHGTKRTIFSKIIQGQAEFLEIEAGRNMKILNTPLAKLSLPDGVIIAAIHRGNETLIPRGDTEIHKGDHIVFLSMLTSIPKLEGLLQAKRWSFR
ncbi:MAG: NAD-binding protein, partial [Firmicutes bacterium]|nr:NAD-binding protein [Bacillota bacterium]